VGLGLDAEPAGPLPAGIGPRISTAWEMGWAGATPAPDGLDWYKLIFSAKESVYKACYPLVRRVLEFAEVEIAIQPTDGGFAVRLPSERLAATLSGRELRGRFAVTRQHVLTGVTILRSAS
jgi:4'-phosphopantetheinyl transferase EntD